MFHRDKANGRQSLTECAFAAGSSISGDVTPASLASELEFNSNEATAGSLTDHDILVSGKNIY